MNVHDLIYGLATKNQPELNYNDFKDEVRKRWSFDIYDSDEVSEFYDEYKYERRKACDRATRHLKSEINAGISGGATIKPGKKGSIIYVGSIS